MALIEMPAWPVPAKIDWKRSVPAKVNESEVTSRRRVVLDARAPRWLATVNMPPILGERAAEAWRAFVVDLDGVANSFRLIACENDQITGVTVQVDGGGQTGFTLATKGWGSAGEKLRRGQFMTVNDQLVMLMAPLIADATGKAIATFKSYIRVPPANNGAIEVKRPYAVVSSTDPDNGWSVGIGQNYAFSFQARESF